MSIFTWFLFVFAYLRINFASLRSFTWLYSLAILNLADFLFGCFDLLYLVFLNFIFGSFEYLAVLDI